MEMLSDEHRTYIENLIIGLEVLAGENARNLSSKDLKAIKRTIKALKSKHRSQKKNRPIYLILLRIIRM